MLRRTITKYLQEEVSLTPVVVLLGANHIGKATLARSISKGIPAIYLDLESPEDLAKLIDPETFFRENSDKMIIIDEIQRSPDLFAILRGIIDRNRLLGKEGSQFLLLGSASMDLLRQSSESLAGRISYVDMTGLNLLEVGNDSMIQLWLRGGFPNCYLANDDNIAMRRLESLISTYLESDIVQMGFNIPSSRLRRLWTMLAHLQGETINFSSLAVNLEVSNKTVAYYIDILTDLLLVRRLNPWHENLKKRLVKSPRFYVRDSGVLHRLLSISDSHALLSSPVLGKSWEGFVIENIHSVLPCLAETYFYRTAAGAEIDLVIKMPNADVWAIEIKYGVAPKLSKHYNQICDDIGASHRFVVYSGDDEFPVKDGVRVISLQKIMDKILNI